MKNSTLLVVTVAAALWSGPAAAQLETNVASLNVNQTVPDGSPIGLAVTTDLAGLQSSIVDVSLGLDITGGFNGDIYAYLAGPGGQLVVLLNRVGVNGASAFGYSDSGFNITLSDGAANGNIHDYQTVSGYAAQLNGGTWVPDGRNIDPLTPGATLEGTATTSDFSELTGSNPNGTWTLFVADMSSGGGTATLDSAVLDIVTIPEPTTGALIAAAIAGFLIVRRRLTV